MLVSILLDRRGFTNISVRKHSNLDDEKSCTSWNQNHSRNNLFVNNRGQKETEQRLNVGDENVGVDA